MGLFDSFYDKTAKCPNCKKSLAKNDFQTKSLESSMESWKNDDFFQYRIWVKLTKKEKSEHMKKHPNALMPPLFKHGDYCSKEPIMIEGKVPCYTSCNCGMWLDGKASIKKGRFIKVVNIAARKI